MASASTIKNMLVADYGYYDSNISTRLIRHILKANNKIDRRNKLAQKKKLAKKK